MGQSSSRPAAPVAEDTPDQSNRRRRLRTRARPTSVVDPSPPDLADSESHTDATEPSNVESNTFPSRRARPRSVHLPDLFHRSRQDDQQVRARSPSTRARISRRRRGVQTLRPSNFTHFFHRHHNEEEGEGTSQSLNQPWSVAPRDSLDMAHAARDRDQARLSPAAPDLQDTASPRLQFPLQHSRPDSSTNNDHSIRPNSSLANRISSLTPAREISRLASSFRRRQVRRSTPVDQNAAMLQRLLSVAAAATAASLTGNNPEAAVNDLRRTAVAVDGEDGSFDNFLQALRSGRLASHLGQNSAGGTGGNQEGVEGSNNDGNQSSLDFFRMFRFGPNGQPASRRSAPATSGGNDSNEWNNGERNNNLSDTNPHGPNQAVEPEARTVSILIVGIRSLNQDADAHSGAEVAEGVPPFIDALTNLNTTINVGLHDPSRGTPIGSPRSGLGLSGLSRNRRASMGGLFAGRDRTRRARSANTGRPLSEIGPSTSVIPDSPEPTSLPPTIPTDRIVNTEITIEDDETRVGEQSDSPRIGTVWDEPPSPVSSRFRFRDSFRDSWRHSWRESWHSSRGNNRSSIINDIPEDDNERSQPRWSRRRSQSQALRFGSGSSRRNGVVEPDHVPSEGETGRSWIIYVLGGSYPENHPILTTPSLFTDNPSYEDMLLLSSLIGPAKPPVAQRDDVDSSGGLFRLGVVDVNSIFHAVHEDGDDGFIEKIVIDSGQTCQICLSAYNLGDMARRLNDCKHLFHRECIDEWLTTGRNSCPLCRTQGVLEKTPPPDPNIHMPGEPGSSRGAASAIGHVGNTTNTTPEGV